MSTLSARAPGIQATANALDARALRIRGMTTLEGVRRNLFGCGDREESRRFVERELARQLECDSQRWGFDFATETPLPGAQRFAWQLVPASAVPSALRRANIAPAPAAVTVAVEVPVSSPEVNKTQKRITDFLKPCKRLAAPSGKKSSPISVPVSTHHHHSCTAHSTHIRPPKVARITYHFSRRAS